MAGDVLRFRRFFIALLCILFTLVTFPQAFAQSARALTFGQKLYDETNGIAEDIFGISVDINADGTVLVVGAPKTFNANSDPGSVYVYTNVDGAWVLQQELIPSNGAALDKFGWSVAISDSGDTILAGAPGRSGGQGAVYAFARSGGIWLEDQMLTVGDAAANDEFGASVDISGDGLYAAIGSHFHDQQGIESGSAYIFFYGGVSWGLQQELISVGTAAGDQFGTSVALNTGGNHVVIGAPFGAGNTGEAFVFARSGSVWSEANNLVASDATAGDQFGMSVAIDSAPATLIVGAPGVDAVEGAAYVFDWTGSAWEENQKLDVTGAAGDQLGMSVSLDDTGTVAMVGRPGENNSTGAVNVFLGSGGVWGGGGMFIPPDGELQDKFGWDVAINPNDDYLVVGAPGDDTNRGSAYAYIQEFTDCNNVVGVPSIECNALVAFYGATGGAGWTNDQGWLANNSPCTWFGITCSGSQISEINLMSNNLTGTLPAQLGNLPALQTLNIYNNQVGGNLPANLFTIPDLLQFNIGDNRFSGALPAGIANWGNLDLLHVNANQFVGDVPAVFATLSNILDGNFSYNMLTATDPGVIGWLNTVQSTWAQTQTIAPSGVGVTWFDDGEAQVTWTPIQYTGDGGYYDVGYGTAPGGPYTFGNQTANKSASQLVVTGLAIDTSYYFVVRTFTPAHGNNQNNLTSPTSLEVALIAAPFVSCSTVVTIPTTQCDALVALYNATNGIGWVANNNWLALNDPCLWLGVTCALGNVTALELPNNSLVGTLPPEIGDLPALLSLDLSNNSLEGNLPSALGSLILLTSLQIQGNSFTGDVPLSITALVNLLTSSTDVGYNLIFASNPVVSTFLNVVDPDWQTTQTLSPNNRTSSLTAEGLHVSWTPIQYIGDGGYYVVTCGTFTLNTINKTQAEVLFTGLPAGVYTCTIATYTPEHENNPNVVLTSPESAGAAVNVPTTTVPPNDLPPSPITFDGNPQQNYSFNIDNASRLSDPQLPIADVDCPILLTNEAVGVHYFIPGSSFGGVGGGGGVVTAGGPGWFRNRDSELAADTAIIVYEVDGTATTGPVVACDDDDAQGEISLSNVMFPVNPDKNYRVVVWNEDEAPQGVVVSVAPSSFNLRAPSDDSVFGSTVIPSTFIWDRYTGSNRYSFEILRISDQSLSRLTMTELTANGNDGDGLDCNANECRLTVQVGSELESYLTLGDYLWTASAKIPADSLILHSNQVFRLTISDVITTELLLNGEFEFDVDNDKVPDEWKDKNLEKDKRKCNKQDKQIAYHGECAFKFKGGPEENASLEQTVSGSGLAVGQTITLSARVSGKANSPKTKLILNIKYVSADASKQKLVLPDDTLDTYTLMVSNPVVLVDSVSSIKVKIKNKNVSGKLLIDSVSLTVADNQGAALRNSDGLIPLPPVPDDTTSRLTTRSNQ